MVTRHFRSSRSLCVALGKGVDVGNAQDVHEYQTASEQATAGAGTGHTDTNDTMIPIMSSSTRLIRQFVHCSHCSGPLSLLLLHLARLLSGRSFDLITIGLAAIRPRVGPSDSFCTPYSVHSRWTRVIAGNVCPRRHISKSLAGFASPPYTAVINGSE
jgi:hypothetical protein